MNTLTRTVTLASTLLTGSSLASAHGAGRDASSFYHYLTGADHVAVFTLIGVAALATGLAHLRRRPTSIQLKSD